MAQSWAWVGATPLRGLGPTSAEEERKGQTEWLPAIGQGARGNVTLISDWSAFALGGPLIRLASVLGPGYASSGPPAGQGQGQGLGLGACEEWESQSAGGPAPSRSLCPSVRVGRGSRAGSGPVPAVSGVRVMAQAQGTSDHGMGSQADGRPRRGRGAREGYASGETKAQRCSRLGTCFPNQGSEQQVRPEQVTSKTALTLCPGHITVTGCLLGRWGRGGRPAGGHPRGPSLRNGTHPCTCTHVPHASMHSPHSASGRRPGLHLPCALHPRGGSAQGGGPRPRQATPEPLTQQRAGATRPRSWSHFLPTGQRGGARGVGVFGFRSEGLGC
ncbi:PREDICTED: protein SPT2 homolog isoform X2 [Myotis brandtii]|uniref:protein SPT2 homolog isoform X1 n=1 Tax=Myotis brandtii TaxID=109478 RepID=UPI00070401A0|nr:PREDICTED: protein SPT2 homolog isoform X1 [Myotis brandtii]XP_014400053.1 PREDICTED: protein SPT2 homolog isoform X2 [Myotis brandtii]